MQLAVRLDTGKGSPVVLLHGFPGTGADWVPVAERLAVAHRVIVVDLLGFGAGPKPTAFSDLWTDAQAEAFRRTLDDLDIERTGLVGHDLGGGVALSFISRFPERVTHLCLLATNTFTDTPVDFPLSMLRLPLVGRFLEPLMFNRVALAALGRVASRTPGVHPAGNTGEEARAVRTVFARVLRELPELYASVENSLASISVPTTVIWAGRDLFFPAEQGRRTASSIEGAKLVLMEESGHFLPIERPNEVAREVLELLSRKPPDERR